MKKGFYIKLIQYHRTLSTTKIVRIKLVSNLSSVNIKVDKALKNCGKIYTPHICTRPDEYNLTLALIRDLRHHKATDIFTGLHRLNATHFLDENNRLMQERFNLTV